MSQIIKLFMDGRSQALNVPAAYQFDSKEINIRQDSHTGDVILSARPDNWDSFIATLNRDAVLVDSIGEAEQHETSVNAQLDIRISN